MKMLAILLTILSFSLVGFGQKDISGSPKEEIETKFLNLESMTSVQLYYRWQQDSRSGEKSRQIKNETTEVLRRDPQNIFALRFRAGAFNSLSNPEPAKNDVKQIVEILKKPVTAEEYETLCFANHVLKQPEAVISDCSKAIELKPNFTSAYITRGYAYNAKGEYTMSIADFTKAVELEPTLVSGYNGRAITYFSSKQFDEAILDFKKVIELRPGFGAAFLGLGHTYYRKQQYDLAIEALTKSINCDGGSVTTFRTRALVYDAIGEKDLAAADRQKAAEMTASNR